MIDAAWAKPTRTLSRRTASVLAWPLGLVTFVVALAFAAIAHLDLPASRMMARNLTVLIFNQAFAGEIAIAELGRLGLQGLTASGVTITDPQNRPVIEAAEVQVDVGLVDLVVRLATAGGTIDLELDRVTLRRPAVYLLGTNERGPDGEPLAYPSIADAFAPRNPTPDDGSSGPPVHVSFPRVRLERFYLRGRVGTDHAGEVNVPLAEATMLVTDEGVNIDVERFGLRASGFGGVDTIAVGEVRMRLPGAIEGAVRGRVGSIPIAQTFRVDGERLLIEGSLPTLEAAALRPLFAGWPLEGTIGVRNRIEGTLPRLNAEVVVTAASGEVRATGLLTTSPGLEADLDVDTKDLDLSALGASLPQTRLNLRSAVEIWLDRDRPNFEINATLAESDYQGTALPVVDLWANYDERGLTADATLHERGLPVHLAVSGHPGQRLDFELEIRRTKLGDSPRLGALLQAQGEVSGEVKGKLEGKAVSAQWTLAGNGLAVRSVALRRLESTGRVALSLDNLDRATVELRAEAKGLESGGIVIPEVRLEAQGPLRRPAVTLDAKTALDAPVHLALTLHPEDLALSNLTGHVGGSDQRVELQLAQASVAGGVVRLQGIQIESGGTLSGDLVVSPQSSQARLMAQSLELRTLVASFGLDRANLAGRLDLDVNATLADDSQGYVRAKLTDGAIAGVVGLDAEVEADLDGKSLTGGAAADLAGVGHASAGWDVTVTGPIALPTSYPGVTGSARLDLEQLELAWLATLLPKDSGLTRTSGTAAAHIELARQKRDAFPDVSFVAKTSGLSLDLGEGAELRRVDAVDLSLRGSLNHERQRLEAALTIQNPEGDLVTANGGIGLPLSDWVAQPPSADELAGVVRTAPVECVVLIPERRLVDFPDFLGVPRWEGRLAARAILRGSLEDPEFDLSASATDLEGGQIGLMRPISFEATTRYRPSNGKLSASLQARQGSSRVASGALKIVLPVESLRGPVPAGTPAWTGVGQVVVEDAPLGLVAAFTEQRLSGAAQGSIAVTRKDYDIDVEASLRLRQLVLGETPLGESDLGLTIRNQLLRANAKLEDEYGLLDAEARLSVLPTPWALEVDRQAEIQLGLESRKHDAAILLPFVGGELRELSGELSGNIELRLRPTGSGDTPMDATLNGQMTMVDGIVTPSAMGLRFADTNFSLAAERQGAFNVLRLSGLRAKARSTTENVRGEATIYLQGLAFDHALFRLEQNNLPLMTAGTHVASVTGTMRGEFRNAADHRELTLHLSGLKVDLPNVANTEVIELSDNPTIDVVQRPKKEAAEEASGSTTPMRVAVDLGRGVKVESSLFQVTVTGRPELELAEATSIDGEVRLTKGGSVTVLGKVFLIEEGLIAFDTVDSTNPHLDITAAWRASSGVVVRAKISGTVRNPTLEWSSDPPLAGGEAEVVALVIGGGGGAGRAGNSQGGVAMAGAAMAVNQLIGETGIRNIEVYAGREAEATEGEVARLSQRSWDSYTASIQLTEDLWFQGSYKTETAGAVAGSQARSGISGTLDWRFAPAWSASTEVGMLGVGVDLLWQHRY